MVCILRLTSIAKTLAAIMTVTVIAFNPIELIAAEWSGVASGEGRYFFEEGDFGQKQSEYSIAVEPEFFHRWEDSDLSIVFKPFLRWDSLDEERSHADIRELMVRYYSDEWELKAGVGKVFWGVAESQHLVDVINQTDFVENIDGEDKLGQQMVVLSTERDYGLLEFFLLPGSRERTFAGEEGRFRFPLTLDENHPIYADEDGKQRLDAAIRWSRWVGDWDFGLSHFSGTSREPLFVVDSTNPVQPKLRPLYVTIDQTSLDLQATKGAWLWKLEALTRSGFSDDRYWAGVGGFEYSFYGITDSGADLGMIVEYQHDSRDTLPGGYEQQDLGVVGFRLAMNDIQSTQALLAYSQGNGQSFLNLEASRRLGDSWKLILEARLFSADEDKGPLSSQLYPFRNDDYFSVTFEKYF